MRFSLRASLWLVSFAAASLLIVSQWVASRQWEQRAKQNKDLLQACRFEAMGLEMFDSTPHWSQTGDQPQSLASRLEHSRYLYAQFKELRQKRAPTASRDHFSVRPAANWNGRDFVLKNWQVIIPPDDSKIFVCTIQEDPESIFSGAKHGNATDPPVITQQFREPLEPGEHWIRLTRTSVHSERHVGRSTDS